MDRARMASPPLPRSAIDIKIVERKWGIERFYKTPNGTEIRTPAFFTSLGANSRLSPTVD